MRSLCHGRRGWNNKKTRSLTVAGFLRADWFCYLLIFPGQRGFRVAAIVGQEGQMAAIVGVEQVIDP